MNTPDNDHRETLAKYGAMESLAPGTALALFLVALAAAWLYRPSPWFAIAWYAVGALLVGAASIFRIRCEGFGCTGVGIAWFAWVALFLPSLGLGFMLGSLQSLGAPLARAARFALWRRAAAGVSLIVLWAAKYAL